MSNRKLQIVLNHPSFAQVLGRTRLHTCLVRASGLQSPLPHLTSPHLFQFARPLSRSSCLRSVSLLPKTGLKPEEYHSARNLVDRGSAASSKTTLGRRLLRTLALGTAPRPIERMPKSGSEPYSRTALTVSDRSQIPSIHSPLIHTSAIWGLLDFAFQASHGTREKTNGGGPLGVLSL